MCPKLFICLILFITIVFISAINAKYQPYNNSKISIGCETDDGFIFLRIDELIINNNKIEWNQLVYNRSSCSSDQIIENKKETTIEKLQLKFQPEIEMDFEFIKINNNTYKMRKFGLMMNETIYGKNAFDLRFDHKLTIDKQGYQCDDLVNNLKINDTSSSNDDNDEAIVQFKKFQFAAYLHTMNITEITFKECNPLPGSQLVPIIVGSGLLVLMGLCLTIYIFMRSRSS